MRPRARGQQNPVEARHPERVAHHGGRAEDRTGVGADDVPAPLGAGHGVEEGCHLGHRVGVRARLLGDRCVLPIESLGGVEERARAHRHHATEVDGLRRIEHVLGAADVHRLEVGQVLAGPTQQSGAMDGGVGTPGRPYHGIGIGDVAGDHLDAQRRERRGVRGFPGQRARTWSPRSARSLQMLAPANPVAPVTRTVWVMPRPAPRGLASRVSTWSGL